jgi:hypothetical protein
MSIKQMTRVFNDDTLKPTKKLIMLAISDSANDSGVAFPSWNTIAQKTGLSRQSLQDNLKQLVDDGYLFKKNRSRKKGGRSSNKYLIYPQENKGFLDEEDYLFFEDLYTQSQGDGLPPQSQGDGLGVDTQSQGDGLESEPSLISSNHHFKNIKKDFTFKLKRSTQYENLSEEYKHNLIIYADERVGNRSNELLSAMIDHHSSNGKGFVDWSAAFRTWERNDKKFGSTQKKDKQHPTLHLGDKDYGENGRVVKL